MFHIKKAWQTFKICKTLFMARTFGEYLYSGYDGGCTYARYRYDGLVYEIPTSSLCGKGI